MLRLVILASIILNLVLAHVIPSRVATTTPAQLVRRQGCDLEPHDPNCELPLWDDKTYNLTVRSTQSALNIQVARLTLLVENRLVLQFQCCAS